MVDFTLTLYNIQAFLIFYKNYILGSIEFYINHHIIITIFLSKIKILCAKFSLTVKQKKYNNFNIYYYTYLITLLSISNK